MNQQEKLLRLRVSFPRRQLNPHGEREAERPVNFQIVATAGEPYCLGPQWHLLV